MIWFKFCVSWKEQMDKTPPPRLSATVLLVRDGADFEVLMVARHYQIDFAAGALVFPGGKSNPEDASPDWAAHVDGAFAQDDITPRIAAIREAFEESGVLLARSRDARGVGGRLVGVDMAEKLAPYRGPVDRREQSFLGLMKDSGLVLALDLLIHFGHWVTPEMMPKRFDTHFYLAKTPAEQIASHDGRETTDAVWLNPQKALEMEARGEATIIFPTRMNLIKLGKATSWAQAADMFTDEPVVRVLPTVGKTGDGKPCLYIPEAAGYGQTMELLSNVKV